MCLILFAYKSHPTYRLILAANRDEFYDRPTAPLAYWQDHPRVLAGRDLQGMGSWMGISTEGRLAAVTNYREPTRQIINATSRGQLVSDFLTHPRSPAGYLESIQKQSQRYNGFNLLVGDASGLFYYSNRGDDPTALNPGIYGLSNHLLDTDWSKVRHGKNKLAALIGNHEEITDETLLPLLQNQENVTPDQLPDTGVSPEWEKILAPIFITSPAYGTRCSSILLINVDGSIQFSEYIWQHHRPAPQLLTMRQFDLTLPADR